MRPRLPGGPVSSYLTLSPLPDLRRAVSFLLHFPSRECLVPGNLPLQEVSLSSAVRTFLPATQ